MGDGKTLHNQASPANSHLEKVGPALPPLMLVAELPVSHPSLQGRDHKEVADLLGSVYDKSEGKPVVFKRLWDHCLHQKGGGVGLEIITIGDRLSACFKGGQMILLKGQNGSSLLSDSAVHVVSDGGHSYICSWELMSSDYFKPRLEAFVKEHEGMMVVVVRRKPSQVQYFLKACRLNLLLRLLLVTPSAKKANEKTLLPKKLAEEALFDATPCVCAQIERFIVEDMVDFVFSFYFIFSNLVEEGSRRRRRTSRRRRRTSRRRRRTSRRRRRTQSFAKP